ncbi:MAG TPA: hypothetical protein DIT28_04960 [Oxalobacteraceae bacterium]|nr:hypothetical protein [Oxalobacteraceae bacterium]
MAKIGHTLWYVATCEHEWVALLSFSASALKCAARDQWIGWDFRHQYGRLKLIANNSRFLILPDCHLPNLASKVLALCQRRIGTDWLARFDQLLLLLETFVDTARYRGTVYRAGNWTCVGQTQGHRRRHANASAAASPTGSVLCPVKAPFATCSSALIQMHSSARCNAGMPTTDSKIKALPSMARPCAMRSTKKGGRPTS